MGYSLSNLNYYQKPPSQPATAQAQQCELAGKVVLGKDSGGKRKAPLH